MAQPHKDGEAGIGYRETTDAYFERRGLRRYAGVFSLWALGVGAVISGDFSGWNLGVGLAGFGGFLIAVVIITAMYVGLCFSTPALLHQRVGKGNAVIFAWNPLHRNINHHDHGFFYNALLNWNDLPEPVKVD